MRFSGYPAGRRRHESWLTSVGRWLLVGFVAAVLFVLLLPTLIIVPMSVSSQNYIEFPPSGFSLKWYWVFFSDADWIAATLFSLRIALTTAITATIVGTLTAIAIVRGDLPGKSLVQGLALSPLIIPQIVIAIALYLLYAPAGLIGNFGGFLLAHTMLAVPYVVITVTAALQRFDSSLELAALNCGATRVQAFFFIVLPSIAPGVAAGAVFAFITSFDEATVSFFISGIDGKTITKKLFEDIDGNLTPTIAVASTVLVGVSLALMAAAQAIQSRFSRAP